jgi:hypothetical protein
MIRKKKLKHALCWYHPTIASNPLSASNIVETRIYGSDMLLSHRINPG